VSSVLQINSLKCSLCGTALKSTPDAGRFVCPACGSEVSIGRNHPNFSFESVIEAVAKLQAGTDKTFAELAIRRLQEELEDLQEQRQELEAAYQNQKDSQTGIAIATSFTAGVFYILIMGFINLFLKTPFSSTLRFSIGLMISIAIYIIYRRKNKQQAIGLTTTVNQQLAAFDHRIYETRMKIIYNRKIADS
jgi:predicted RNA-binding Zn-ribbon protein involved in translation (DUF1610 family)/uncharacterized membrane protein (DUF485 family)